MNFQENKFPIVLGAVTAVVAGGLIWWGLKSAGAYNDAKETYDTAVSEIAGMKRAKVPPTEDNQREKAKAVAEYHDGVGKLQAAFDKYRKPKLEDTEVSVFTDALQAARKRLGVKFEESGTALPESFFLGLGKFTNELPQEKSTGVLHFELQALEDLFSRLAEAAPSQVLNAHWEDIPEENGQEYDFNGKDYRAHSVELTFQGREDSLRAFLSSLDDSDNFYYVVRSMRVKNTSSAAPNAKDATFEAVEEAGDGADSDGGGEDIFGGGGFVFPDEEGEDEPVEDDGAEEAPAEETPAEPAAPAGTEILKEVLGSEEIQVFMRIDILQFIEAKPLPKN